MSVVQPHSLPKRQDIVDSLRDMSAATEKNGAIMFSDLKATLDKAAIEIVRLRSTLWELSACVQGAEKRKEAVKHAKRLAPLPDGDAFLLHQFHKVDLKWNTMATGKEVPW